MTNQLFALIYPRATEVLFAIVERGEASGLQASLVKEGSHLSLVTGECFPGRKMKPSTIFKVWCGTKPLLGATVRHLAEGGVVDPDIPVGDLIEIGAPGLAACSLRTLLAHEGPCSEPSLSHLLLTPCHKRASLVDAVLAGTAASGGVGYSSYLAWEVVVRVAESLTGMRAGELIGAYAGEFKVDIFVDGDQNDYLRVRDRLGVYVSPRSGRPWLQDCTEYSWTKNSSPSLGGYATSGALTGWLSKVKPLGRANVMAGPHALYEWGLMTGLSRHGFSRRLSSGACGQVGWQGSSFYFYEPDEDLSFAVIASSAPQDGGATLASWRVAVCDALLDDIRASRP